MMQTTLTASWVVWTDHTARIASFHPVGGYREQSFRDHSHFMNFLEGLQSQGYRFQ